MERNPFDKPLSFHVRQGKLALQHQRDRHIDKLGHELRSYILVVKNQALHLHLQDGLLQEAEREGFVMVRSVIKSHLDI